MKGKLEGLQAHGLDQCLVMGLDLVASQACLLEISHLQFGIGKLGHQGVRRGFIGDDLITELTIVTLPVQNH